MKCPNLMKWTTFFSKAEKELYSPSLFQLEEYYRGMNDGGDEVEQLKVGSIVNKKTNKNVASKNTKGEMK